MSDNPVISKEVVVSPTPVDLENIIMEYNGFKYDDGLRVANFLKATDLFPLVFHPEVPALVKIKFFPNRATDSVSDYILRHVLIYPLDYGISKHDILKVEQVTFEILGIKPETPKAVTDMATEEPEPEKKESPAQTGANCFSPITVLTQQRNVNSHT